MYEATRGRRRPSRRGYIATGVAALGVTVGIGSWLLRDSAPWWSSTLGNVAVAILLLVPGELALRWVRSGFARVERATEEVRVTAETAQSTAERTERTLEDVRSALLDRQVEEHAEELDVFRNLIRDPSRDSLMKALRRATADGVITAAGVRTPVWQTDLHYRWVLSGIETGLLVQLEADDATVLSSHPWSDGTLPEDFYQGLVEAVRAAGRDLGVLLNDPTQSVQDLSEMLVEVWRKRSQELMGYRDHLSRIIERVDGWYFTETAILPADDLRYEIRIDRLGEIDWEDHLVGKGWAGAPAALAFARRLYRLSDR